MVSGSSTGAEVASQGGDEGGILVAVVDVVCAALGAGCGPRTVVGCSRGCGFQAGRGRRFWGRKVGRGDGNVKVMCIW